MLVIWLCSHPRTPCAQHVHPALLQSTGNPPWHRPAAYQCCSTSSVRRILYVFTVVVCTRWSSHHTIKFTHDRTCLQLISAMVFVCTWTAPTKPPLSPPLPPPPTTTRPYSPPPHVQIVERRYIIPLGPVRDNSW